VMGSAMLMLTWGNAFAQTTQPSKIRVAPDKVFAPTGFDDNDNAQIVLSGAFSNTCYKAGQVSATVDEITRQIRVKNEAYFFDSSWCLFVMVPWTQTVNLGTVPAGEYEVRFEQDEPGEAVASSKFGVSAATHSGADNFLYALVDEVTLEHAEDKQNGGTQLRVNNEKRHLLSIQGSLPSSCAKLKEVRVVRNQKDVFEVLPIVEVEQNRICQPVLRPFRTTVDLGLDIQGEALVHVRSLNGQAVNRVLKF
jgi:hypothetical protein